MSSKDLPTMVGRLRMQPNNVAGFGGGKCIKQLRSCLLGYCNLDADTIRDSEEGVAVRPGYFYRRIRMSFGWDGGGL